MDNYSGNIEADLKDQERERAEAARAALNAKQESAESKKDNWLTQDEVCGLLNINRQSLWRAVRLRQIPHQRFSKKGRIQFVKADIIRFIELHTYSNNAGGSVASSADLK